MNEILFNSGYCHLAPHNRKCDILIIEFCSWIILSTTVDKDLFPHKCFEEQNSYCSAISKGEPNPKIEIYLTKMKKVSPQKTIKQRTFDRKSINYKRRRKFYDSVTSHKESTTISLWRNLFSYEKRQVCLAWLRRWYCFWMKRRLRYPKWRRRLDEGKVVKKGKFCSKTWNLFSLIWNL